MMTENILNSNSVQFEEMVRNVELLKLRFGEASLQSCDVMLKDLKDSKRLMNEYKQEISRPNYLDRL